MKPVQAVHLAQRGLALVAVLWVVLALSLMLSGLLGNLRAEIRQTGAQRVKLQAQAQAQAGMWLALQQLEASDAPWPAQRLTQQLIFQGQPVEVRIWPLNGLIDLNNAPAELLAALFRVGAGMDAGGAIQAAEALLEMRKPANSAQGLESPEDLMRLPNFTYEYFAAVADLVTTDVKMGSGRVNPYVAPVEVLRVLTGGDARLADDMASRQDESAPVIDLSRLPPAFVEREASDAFVLESRLPLPDGGQYLLRWVVHHVTDPASGLPWRVVRTSNKQLPAS